MAVGQMFLYLDGLIEASAALTAVADGNIFNEDGLADPFLIGANRIGGGDAYVSFFTGVIDEVGYANRALSPAEMFSIYSAGSAGKCVLSPTILVNGRAVDGGSIIVTNSASIELRTGFPGGHVFFTLDGSLPGLGNPYSSPFVVTQAVTLRALAYGADFAESAPASPVAITVVSPPSIVTAPVGRMVGNGAEVAFTWSRAAPNR